MGLYSRARSLDRFALVFAFARSLASLLPRYLVQLFRRLKGPQYADTLFVTRESRRGCLRQADATPPVQSFPLGQEIANVAARLYRTLIFRHRLATIFPFPVGFRRLFYLPAATREGGFQPPRGRSSRASCRDAEMKLRAQKMCCTLWCLGRNSKI